MPLQAADVRSVRALAHPLRLQLLDLLRSGGPSTATRLARRLGESSGATSFHLRQLAKYGYIDEVPRDGGRERWWRYLERPIHVRQRGNQRLHRLLAAEMLAREARALDAFLAARDVSADWDRAAFFSTKALRLTPAQLEELQRALDALLAPLPRVEAGDPPPGARVVRFLATGFPGPEGEG
jgi:DNA-binding transcriptional ArsR family regulator